MRILWITLLHFVVLLVYCTHYVPISSAAEPMNGVNAKQEDSFSDLSGFIIGVKGLIGFTLPSFTNRVEGASGVVPGKFSSPVEGGGGVLLGVRLGISGEDAPVPVYIRFELEYSQRVPYNLNGRTGAFTITDRGGLPDPTYGFEYSRIAFGFQDVDFKLRVASQQVTGALYLDIDTRSAVVPYIGALFGITIFDVQMQSTAEVFVPLPPKPGQPVGTNYGTIETVTTRGTTASFLWGIGLGTQIIVNDYIMFDIGGRYLNNISFNTGRAGVLELDIKYDYIEMYMGLNVLL